MEYEVVELTEKMITGTAARTSNERPEMSEIIGGLWGKLYQGGLISKIENRANAFPMASILIIRRTGAIRSQSDVK